MAIFMAKNKSRTKSQDDVWAEFRGRLKTISTMCVNEAPWTEATQKLPATALLWPAALSPLVT